MQAFPNAFHHRTVAMDSEIRKMGRIDFQHLRVKLLSVSSESQFCPQTRRCSPPSPGLIYFSFWEVISAHSELLREEANHDTRGKGQEAQQIRYQEISFDHRRR
jgi:hypothetical protein